MNSNVTLLFREAYTSPDVTSSGEYKRAFRKFFYLKGFGQSVGIFR